MTLHALVTGGGTGVGLAVGRRLLSGGYRVTVVGRRPEPLERFAAEAPGVFAAPADVTSPEQLGAAFDRAVAEHGPIDAVVANAGVAESAPFHRLELERWRELIEVNLTGAFVTAQQAARCFRGRKGGRLVFVASTAAVRGYPYVAAYCASKHGVLGLCRSLAAEWAGSDRTVNAVCPGYVETDMLDRTVANIAEKTGKDPAAARAALLEATPLGRFVQPAEVAEAVAYLLSPLSACVTGQALMLDGGER